MDVIEANEAFAAQACAVVQDLGLDPAKVNPNGSGISLGHPIGATGAIITTKAIAELHRAAGRYALVTMCIGGGQGIAAIFERHLLKGQNHGLFLDMAEGRRWVRAHCAAHPGLKVLNLFAYTCAFSVVALQAGARQVVNLDMSQGALAIGQQNHALNGLADGAAFLAHDLFKSWGKITRAGPYGLVIVDPPSFQKGSFVATKDYARLMRRLPDLLTRGGHGVLCLNAPELETGFLQEQMHVQAPDLHFEQRLPNPPAFADIAPERALKVLVYRAPG
jgi:23S rRNA (cytosine1962-C5)-methyltransferase